VLYNFVTDIRGSFFIRLAVVAFQNREITENSDKIGPYSRSRLPKSKVMSWCQSKAQVRLPI